MGKNFTTLSQKECAQHYHRILANADEKWLAGESLAKLQIYGTAASLQIISIEESVKGFIVYLDSRGFEIRKIPGLGSLFKNHKIRYLISYFIFAVAIIGEDFSGWVVKINSNPELFKKLSMDIEHNKSRIQSELLNYITEKIKVFKKESAWFSNIDIFRQDGFYTDFKDVMKSPLQITENDFNELNIRLTKVRKFIVQSIEAYEEDEKAADSRIKPILESIKEKDFYTKIGHGIKDVLKPGANPFEYIKNTLSIFDDLDPNDPIFQNNLDGK